MLQEEDAAAAASLKYFFVHSLEPTRAMARRSPDTRRAYLLPAAFPGSVSALAAATLVLGACERAALPTDATDPPDAGPSASVAAADPAASNEPPPPGAQSVFLPASATSFTGDGPVDIPGGGFEFPTLVEVEIRGFVSLTWAYPPQKEGDFGGLVDAAGVQRGTSCHARVQVRFSVRGLYAPCDAFSNTPPREVWSARIVAQGEGTARRSGGPRNGWLRCQITTNHPPCYTKSGGATITVTPIADQLEVEADTTGVAPGTTVTFTASTADGTPFEVQEWIWVQQVSQDETDALADSEPQGVEAGPSTVASSRTVCGSDRVCQHAPETAGLPLHTGTMYVRAVVGGMLQQASVPVTILEPQGELVLTCEPTNVVRGDPIRCALSTDPAGLTLENPEWTFEGGGFRREASGVDEWMGPMVVGGTITARADVAGDAKEESAAITVEPRPWDDYPIEMTITPVNPSDRLSLEPDSAADLGVTLPGAAFKPGGGWFDEVETGPNAGLAYMTDVPLVFDAEVHINYAAMDPNSSFMRIQRGPHPWCTRRDRDRILSFVIEHEGLNFEPNSHTYRFREKAREITGPKYEPLVSDSTEELIRTALELRDAIYDEAADYSDRLDDAPGNPGCNLRF